MSTTNAKLELRAEQPGANDSEKSVFPQMPNRRTNKFGESSLGEGRPEEALEHLIIDLVNQLDES
ncbi:MAG: hypothetical protein NZ899_04325 [Thermoguttaceae bacterium]|nr:hypothetical protein [Thermoguttaceae bacterium]MDW8077638.1 hypothetical protein [Thermoguttaceae bacterium]